MDPTTKWVTADELWQMPGNGQSLELVRGELCLMSPTGGEHGGVTINLTGPLWVHTRCQDLGRILAAETGFILSRNPDTVRAADIALVRKERIPAGGLPKKFIPFAPDLAVEVLSPHDVWTEVERKVAEWLNAGTRLVWVVVPNERAIKVYRSLTDVTTLTDQDELDGEDVVPGFRLPVRQVFE